MAFAQRIGLLLFLLATAGFFSVASPHFPSLRNIFNIFVQSSPTLLAAVGMTVVIATAGIDLSVGSIMALSGILAALAMKTHLAGVGGYRRIIRALWGRPGERIARAWNEARSGGRRERGLFRGMKG